jgi:crotonobetainyl-CoA:carnitine CoA-transferase CaiB-like acyl-CoA transferase
MTGEHTRETLAGLGYDTQSIDALIAAGVVQQYTGGRT